MMSNLTFFRFSWRRNGKFFNLVKDPRVTTRKHSGTLEISFRSGGRPEDYEGEYQCFASNELGVALSNKILFRVSSENALPTTCCSSRLSVFFFSDCFCALLQRLLCGLKRFWTRSW